MANNAPLSERKNWGKLVTTEDVNLVLIAVIRSMLAGFTPRHRFKGL